MLYCTYNNSHGYYTDDQTDKNKSLGAHATVERRKTLCMSFCFSGLGWQLDCEETHARQTLNEPTPTHRNCIPDRPHRLTPQRAEKALPALYATQASSHVLHRPRPRRSTRAGTSYHRRGSCSRSHRRGMRNRLWPTTPVAKEAQEYRKRGEDDAKEEERCKAEIRTECGVNRLH